MRLPVSMGKYTTPPAHWERWLACLRGSFIERYKTSDFDHNILVHLVSLYCAFDTGQGIARNTKLYDGFTRDLVDLVCGAARRCVKRDLALYVIDMCVLVLEVSPVPIIHCACPSVDSVLMHSLSRMLCLSTSPMPMPMPMPMPSPSIFVRHHRPSAQQRTFPMLARRTRGMSPPTPCHPSLPLRIPQMRIMRTVTTFLIAPRTQSLTPRRMQ